MTKRKGDHMIDIMKENYQDSETDFALYVGEHRYEDVPNARQATWYVKGDPDEVGRMLAWRMEKSDRVRVTILRALHRYFVKQYGREKLTDVLHVLELYNDVNHKPNDFVKRYGREQLMDVLRVLELYNDANNKPNDNNTNEA